MTSSARTPGSTLAGGVLTCRRMTTFENTLILLLLIAGLSVVGRWLPWPLAITYLLGGVGAALFHNFPRLELDPETFFLCFLPPLLFADGWLMPLREFVRSRRSILTLAIGLVFFTTAAVGVTAWLLVPGLPLAMAFALGAIVSPTDAVAVNAIMEKLRVPSRLATVLNGESLMNDATGLVAFKFALAAVIAGSFSLGQFAWQFSLVSVGGFATGLAIGWGIGQVRDLLRRVEAGGPTIEITLSLMSPFAAFLAAAHVGASAVLSVVAAGLYAGWRDPVRMDVETRQSAFAVWGLLIYWLNGIAFVLLGLQFPIILASVRGTYSLGELAGFTAAVAGAAIVARFFWVFAGLYVPDVLRGLCRREARAATGLVVSWAGMRGTVTLAGALSIPYVMPNGAPFPGRDIVVFLAFGVIAVTLLLQGTTLEWLIHRVKLREDNSREKEELLARTSAVAAGLAALRELEAEAKTPDHNAALGQVISEYENRLAVLEAQGETRTSARRRRRAGHRYRSIALKAERTAVDGLWRGNQIADEVHRPLQQLLDHEEALLLAGPPPSEDEGASK